MAFIQKTENIAICTGCNDACKVVTALSHPGYYEPSIYYYYLYKPLVYYPMIIDSNTKKTITTLKNLGSSDKKQVLQNGLDFLKENCAKYPTR